MRTGQRLLTTAEAAALTGMSKSWLEKQRTLGPGYGPRYIKVGKSVRYRIVDLEDFITSRVVG